MKYLYLFTLITLTGCAMQTQWQTQSQTLLNPVNGKVVKCEVGSTKPGQGNESFESIPQCIQQYKDMGFWSKSD